MDLKEIASISGKSGLYKVLKPTRNGVIVETLDEKKIKTVAGATSRVSVLKEVSIYTNNEEGSIPLKDVLQKMFETLKGEIEISSKSTNNELFAFLEKLVPDFDREKVYPSDVKKLVNWYQILLKFSPETLENLGKEEEPKEVAEVKEEKPKKTIEKGKKETAEVKAEKEVVETKEEKTKKTVEKKTKVAEVKEEKPKKTAEKTTIVVEAKEEKPKKTAEKTKKEVAEVKEEKPKKTAEKTKKEVAEVKEAKPKKNTKKKD